MLPYILLIIGAIPALYGVFGLLRLLLLPLRRADQVVYHRVDDYLFYENARGRRFLNSQIRYLLNIYIVCIMIGVVLMFAGIYIGFTEYGDTFWLAKRYYQEQNGTPVNDHLNDEGQYIAADGKAYTYYIRVTGEEIYLRDEVCADTEALRAKMDRVDRMNEVILYDDYAGADAYHDVADLLRKLGIRFLEESN